MMTTPIEVVEVKRQSIIRHASSNRRILGMCYQSHMALFPLLKLQE
jgi:hypothetical protein